MSTILAAPPKWQTKRAGRLLMTPALFHQHHNQPWPLPLFICAMDARMA
ncbi:MAG: hypothetical protein SOV43_06135 [Selenomonadaceae bacterium]|nr:hypothetical protein [Selenomonadaceae bacterium]